MANIEPSSKAADANSDVKSNKWLDAYQDPIASLYTFTQCVTLSDIQADGDWKLIIADLGSGSFNMKLKVYKGTDLMSENTIIDLPTGVVTFYMDTHEPRTPAIAVASGPYIYIYKNLRPYFKFTLPPLEVNSVEEDLWNQVRDDKINVFVLRDMLEGMRTDGTTLTVRSLRYLQLTDTNDMASFCEVYKHTPLKRQTVITCLGTLKKTDGTTLTVRSLRYLQLTDTNDMASFCEVYKHTPLKRQTVITCLGTLKKSMSDEDAISCLVLGTENKSIYVLDPEAFTVLATYDLRMNPSIPKRQTVITCLGTLKMSMSDEDAISCLVLGTEDKSIYVLDPEAFTVLATMNLPSVPVFLSVTGMYDVEYRIVVACRNGCIYTLKRGVTDFEKNCIELSSQPVGMERLNKTIYVACMDQTLKCFTSKGKRMWNIRLPKDITTIEVVDYKPKGFKAVLVALSSCEVHVYKEKYLVDIIKTPDVVTAMRFGRFGREDGALVMITSTGGLIIKILKRTATFEERDLSGGPPAAQNVKLNVPKKTKLFVDQTLRERENGVTMHRTFQRDLYLLRLNTAREYLKTLKNSLNPISTDPMEPLKLNARIQGIGPTFKLTVNLQNTSMNQVSTNLFITFDYDDRLYNFKRTYIPVPMLVPGLNYTFETYIECLSDKGVSDTVKVYVLKESKSTPIITGLISMPVSETLVVV